MKIKVSRIYTSNVKNQMLSIGIIVTILVIMLIAGTCQFIKTSRLSSYCETAFNIHTEVIGIPLKSVDDTLYTVYLPEASKDSIINYCEFNKVESNKIMTELEAITNNHDIWMFPSIYNKHKFMLAKYKHSKDIFCKTTATKINDNVNILKNTEPMVFINR